MENKDISVIPKEVEWAITLGVKSSLREKYSIDALCAHTREVFHKVGYSQLAFTIEEYDEHGYHVHVYYKGPVIFWIAFNKIWNIGYVKNKRIYDLKGWLKYMIKHSEVTQYNINIYRIIDNEDDSILQMMSGLSVSEAVAEYRHNLRKEPHKYDLNRVSQYVPDSDDEYPSEF